MSQRKDWRREIRLELEEDEWAGVDRLFSPRAIREAMRSGVVKGVYAQLEPNLDDLAGVGIEL